MPQLSELQIAFISDEIYALGVDLNDLHDDLLDHICTAIESRMDAGESFESAFQQTIKLFGPGGLMQVQEQTLLLLTQMNETMKKLSLGFGLASTALLLAGMLFKIMHWPGAGILMILGNFCLVALYLPILLYHKLKESKKEEYPALILGFVGLFFFATGTTFKIMHWPFASIMLYGGFLTLALGFLPIYFFSRYRSSVNKSITLTTGMLVLIGVIQVGQLLNLRNSLQFKHSSAVINEVLENELAHASQNSELLNMMGNDPKAKQLHGQCDSLINEIQALKLRLMAETADITETEAAKIKLAHLEKLDNFDIPSHILVGAYDAPNVGDGSALKLLDDIKTCRQTILNCYNADMQRLIEPTIAFQYPDSFQSIYGQTEGWAHYHFYNVTVASAVIHLSEIQYQIRAAENQALLYLTTQLEPPGPPSSEI